MTDAPEPVVPLAPLDAVTAEIEAHVAAGGWDQAPAVFALVPTRTVAADPEGAQMLGLAPGTEIPTDSLTPVAQDPLPSGELDEALAGIEWPDLVAGCAVTQEIVVLPPSAEASLPDGEAAVAAAAAHPERREARLVVSVLRDGTTSGVLHLRGVNGDQDEIVFGAEIAPNLAAALQATLG